MERDQSGSRSTVSPGSHPPLQGHKKDWEGRGARVPADAGGGQDSRVERHGGSSVRVPAVSQGTATVVAALAVLAALWHSHLPSPNCHKGSGVRGTDTNSVTRFLPGFHFAVYIPIQSYFPPNPQGWLSPEPLAPCCAHNQKTSWLLQCVVLGPQLFLLPGSVLVIQKRD